MYKNIKFEFNDTFIIIKAEGVELKLDWQEIQNISIDSNFILLYQNNLLVHLIPLRFFDDRTQINDFLKITKSKLQ